LAANTRLFFVEHQERIIAGGLFLLTGKTLHYHLGGSCTDAQRFAPNNLLFHEVALWAQRHGFDILHLGGGRTNAPDDLLLRFKRRFSRELIPFHLGKRVHDQAQYDHLCDIWTSQHGEPMSTAYFPPYRAPAGRRVTSEHAA
jgi:hypothetical protein